MTWIICMAPVKFILAPRPIQIKKCMFYIVLWTIKNNK